MIAVVENFLYKWISENSLKLHPVNSVIRLFSLPDQDKDIGWFAEKSNLSYRQFDRVFKTNTGILPNEYRTLVKLDNAYLIKNRNPDKDWLSIALESGFYDYQHLARHYKDFLGYLPTEFYKLEQNAPERYFGDFEH